MKFKEKNMKFDFIMTSSTHWEHCIGADRLGPQRKVSIDILANFIKLK